MKLFQVNHIPGDLTRNTRLIILAPGAIQAEMRVRQIFPFGKLIIEEIDIKNEKIIAVF